MKLLAMDRAIEGWSRGSSWLHRRDARAKLAVLLVLLIAISTTTPSRFLQANLLTYASIVLLGALVARLPVATLLSRAAWVLPFSLTFAGLVYWSGDTHRALAMVEKSYLSACTTLLFIGTTPLDEWTAALEQWHVPQSLILVIQFLYRYLFLVVDQAHRMQQASSLRRGVSGGLLRGLLHSDATLFEGAAGTVGVLFALSWKRSNGVYQSMLARGFHGHYPRSVTPAIAATDAAFLLVGLTLPIAVRLLPF